MRSASLLGLGFLTLTIPLFVLENSLAAGASTQVSIVQGSGRTQSSTGYSPATVRVFVGLNSTVIWTNNDNTNHTVTSQNGRFSSKDIVAGQTYSFTFVTPGTYVYYCAYHGWMHGTVIVETATTSTSTASSTSSTTSTYSTTSSSASSSTTTTSAVPEFSYEELAITPAFLLVVLLLGRTSLSQSRRDADNGD